MSVILITSHNENIYDIKPQDKTACEAPVPYKSKRRHLQPTDHFKKYFGKNQHATMGVPEEIPPDPAKFLKKKTGQLSYSPQQAGDKTPPLTFELKMKTPTVQECLKSYKKPETKENFVCKNIQNVVNMKTKEPVPKIVVERFGESRLLSRGLEPIYIKSKMFGKKPLYLIQYLRNKQEQYYKDVREDVLTQKPKCRYIESEERKELLNGLKANWEELSKEYQVLPILTDTISKINRKCKLEEALKQLEKDIVLVEKHPFIYVYENDDLYQL